MDAVVQLLRNALCCIKDWNIFSETYLYDPKHTAKYYQFPEPMDKTTPLEILISITQFYAFVSTTRAGYRLITESGFGKLRRINRLIKMQSAANSSNIHDKIVQESLAVERSAALRSIYIGINVISIGFAFFWLFANSLHVTETPWIGGVQGLIHALTVMEAALFPLLIVMIRDGLDQLRKSKRMSTLVSVLKNNNTGLSEDNLNAENYSWIVTGGWSPFWSNGHSVLEPLPDGIQESKELNEEAANIKITLEALLKPKKVEPTEKQRVIMTKALTEAANRLEEDVSMVRMTGYREFLYFVLNWIAFYGYLLGIIVFYFDNDDFQPSYVGSIKFGMTNSVADWRGNFAGDFMWTIEPVVILGSPMILDWMKPKIAKIKKD